MKRGDAVAAVAALGRFAGGGGSTAGTDTAPKTAMCRYRGFGTYVWRRGCRNEEWAATTPHSPAVGAVVAAVAPPAATKGAEVVVRKGGATLG
eukprot:gene3845-4845_t